MTDLSSTQRPIHEEYSDWQIEPIQPVGWAATRYNGASSHTVAAPTIAELRQKLADIRDRKARP